MPILLHREVEKHSKMSLSVLGFKIAEETCLWALILKRTPQTTQNDNDVETQRLCLTRLEDICNRNNNIKR